MTRIMICKKNENEAMRFREIRKRLLTIPLSEKQILRSMKESDMDTLAYPDFLYSRLTPLSCRESGFLFLQVCGVKRKA